MFSTDLLNVGGAVEVNDKFLGWEAGLAKSFYNSVSFEVSPLVAERKTFRVSHR